MAPKKNASDQSYLVLGLDLGIASCGFCLIDRESHEILEIGSRLFPAPQTPKQSVSLAAVRRGYRSSRRMTDRAQKRKRDCLALLKAHNLVPKDVNGSWFKLRRGEPKPVELRAQGLDRLLTDREWALVLYVLVGQRGYMSGCDGSDPDSGKVKKALAANDKLIGEGKTARTFAEWRVYEANGGQVRSRNGDGTYDLCVRHDQLVEELEILFERQRALGNRHATEELQAAYLEIFNRRRSTADTDARSYAQVGACVYFPHEKRAARCTLTSEMASALAALKHVTLQMPDDTESALAPDIIDACMGLLFPARPLKVKNSEKLTFSKLRTLFDIPGTAAFKGIAGKDEGKRVVFDPKGWRAVRYHLRDRGDAITALRENRDMADASLEAVAYSSSADVLAERLASAGVPEPVAAALLSLPLSSPAFNGYGSRSKRALDLLLNSLEDPAIRTLSEAEEACGLQTLRLDGSSIPRSLRLIPFEGWLDLTGNSCSNPVVLRAMAQMRKVVNAVVAKHGPLDEIHVELTKDLAKSKAVKSKIEKSNRENERAWQATREEVRELGIDPDSIPARRIARYRLWKLQGGRDIYTDEPIEDPKRLLEDDGYAEIDHILPRSRTGDNSKSNLVLTTHGNNQRKCDRSPYEWMTSGEEGAPDWDTFRARVTADPGISGRKRSNLLETDLEGKQAVFIARNLTDTGYICTWAARYLRDCLEFRDDGLKDHVAVVSGRLTSWVRKAWGLNFGKGNEKDRSDDRHHAVDAAVIAAIDRGSVQRAATLSKRGESGRAGSDIDEWKPWPSFDADVRARWDSIGISRFIQRKGTGQAFELTRYSVLEVLESGKLIVKGKEKPLGNYRLFDDGKTAMRYGDMVCLRLWRDADGNRWLADPIYVADIPKIRDGSYLPRIAKNNVDRSLWEPIPEKVLHDAKFVEIKLGEKDGDIIEAAGRIGKVLGFNSAHATWEVEPLDGLKGFPSIARGLRASDLIKVMRTGIA